MNYRKARWATWIILGVLLIAVSGTSLLFSCVSDESKQSIAIGVLLFMLIAMGGIGYISACYYRCPHCDRHLGRSNGEHCPHCGVWMEEHI